MEIIFQAFTSKISKAQYLYEVAERELDKRLELLDETKENMNLPKGKYISFNNLYKKYKGKKFTSDELLKIEERKGKSPILTKAIAYAYYQEMNMKKH